MIKTNKQYIPSFILTLLSALAFIGVAIYIFYSPSTQPIKSDILNWSFLLSIFSIATLSFFFIFKKDRPMFIFILPICIPLLISIYNSVNVMYVLGEISFSTTTFFSVFPLISSILTLTFFSIYVFSGKQQNSTIVLLSTMIGTSFYHQTISVFVFNIAFPHLTTIIANILFYIAIILFVISYPKSISPKIQDTNVLS